MDEWSIYGCESCDISVFIWQFPNINGQPIPNANLAPLTTNVGSSIKWKVRVVISKFPPNIQNFPAPRGAPYFLQLPSTWSSPLFGAPTFWELHVELPLLFYKIPKEALLLPRTKTQLPLPPPNGVRINVLFGLDYFCQLILLFSLFLLLLIDLIIFFCTIYESYCIISTNFYIYLSYFQ